MTKETKQKETITLYLDDYITLKHGLESDSYYMDDEFWHQEIRDLINDGEYGIAGSKLMQMQDKFDALGVIGKIEKERGKINEKKEERTITTIAKEFLSGKDKTN